MAKNNINKVNNLSRLVGLSAFMLIAVLALIFVPNNKFSGTKTLNLKPAVLTLIGPVGLTASVGQVQNISWTSTDYNADKVNINLIRKVSSNPSQYELVRTIASNTANDGQVSWVPNPNDTGNLYIEVACVTTDQACVAGEDTSKPLAVINNARFANTASAYEAMESMLNR